MPIDETKAVADALDAQRMDLIENGIAVARRLKTNVAAINQHLREEDAAVVDEVQAKAAENQARLEAESTALKKSLKQAVMGTKQKRRMFLFMLLTIIGVGLLCRVT